MKATNALLTTLALAGIALSTIQNAQARQIVFSSDRSGNYDLWRMNDNGTGLQRLTSHADSEYDPKVAPDGTLIAYLRVSASSTEVRVMNADGSNDRLVKSSGNPVGGLAWLPNGTGLVCSLPPECSAKAYCVLLDGTTSLFFDASLVGQGQVSGHASFSRDGQRYAFSAQAGCTSPTMEVYIAGVTNGVIDTSSLLRLTTNGESDAWPFFSPDGTQLVYMHVLGDFGYQPPNEILVRQSDGSGTPQRIAANLFDPYPTDWSTDGKILLSSHLAATNLNPQIWVVNPDGTGLTSLTTGAFNDWDAQWLVPPGSPCPNALLCEDFEDGVLDSRISVQVVGTFNSAPGIKSVTELGSAKAFGFGRSTCPANCFANFETYLKVTFPSPMWIERLEFKDIELFGNWGSAGIVYYDGVEDTSLGFSRPEWNDRQPDTTYRYWVRPVNRMVTEIKFRVSDITTDSEVFLDDLAIYGSPYHTDLQMCAALDLYGPTNTNYRIEYKTVLNTNWTLLTNVLATTIPFTFVDLSSRGQPQRFYRAVP